MIAAVRQRAARREAARQRELDVLVRAAAVRELQVLMEIHHVALDRRATNR